MKYTNTAKFGVPIRAPRDGDAGYDIYSNESFVLYPGERRLVDCGFAVAIPEGHVGLIKDRSSIASKGVVTSAGVIDSAYRGVVKVLVTNTNRRSIWQQIKSFFSMEDEENAFRVARGQKLTQMLVIKIYTEALEEVNTVDDLGETERGEGGFGSTGK